MAIEYKNRININKNSFIYAHLKENEAGFPEEPGNAPVQQVLDLAEDQIIGTLSQVITFSKDVNNSLIYHMNIAGVSIATFEVPPDKFLKKVEFFITLHCGKHYLHHLVHLAFQVIFQILLCLLLQV